MRIASTRRLAAISCSAAWLAFAASPSGGAAAPNASACTLDRAGGTTIDARPFVRGAYGLRWNAATDRLAFMQPDASGYDRISTMRPDGRDRVALTAGRPGLPSKHQGSAYWHPSGRFVLFTAEKADWSGRALFGVPDYEALPGFGRHDDLWLIAADGSHSWRLTNDPNTEDEGILIPVFSPDGTKIAWSSRRPGGAYVLRVADFAERPEPHLGRIRSYAPGNGKYYETGSFSSDGRSLAYTSDQDTHTFWRSQIYRLDLASGTSARLTPGGDYNEHPTVVRTPSGDWIVYMSTKGVDRFPGHLMLGTDWYAMKLDGSGAKRLTTMNVIGDAESSGAMQVAGTIAISPSGESYLGDVQDSLVKQTGLVRVVRFTCSER